MTLMENPFQTTGNATNRTLPFRRFAAAALWRTRAGTARTGYIISTGYSGCLHARDAHGAYGLRHHASARTANGPERGNKRKPPGSSVRFQISDAGLRACAPSASPINVANASATLSLDMTAEEAAATPFYANFTQ